MHIWSLKFWWAYVNIRKIPLKGGQMLYLCVYPILYYWVLQSLLIFPLCPPSFLCWLGLKHGCNWGKRDNHVWLLSFNWWLHVMQKRISNDLDKFGKKVQPFKKHTPPLILFSGSQSWSLDPHASTICCGNDSKNTSHFTSYPLSFE